MTLFIHAIIAVSWFTPKPRTYVYVKNCTTLKFEPVYVDSRKTTLMSNPFLSDAQGNFTFFIEDTCAAVSVDGGKYYYIFQSGEQK